MPRRSQSNANAMPMKGGLCGTWCKGSYFWRVPMGIVERREAQGLAGAIPAHCAMPKQCPIQIEWGNPFARWISIRILCGRCHYESFFGEVQ
eukprot:2392459-Pyramimonas_sp.AAC.1